MELMFGGFFGCSQETCKGETPATLGLQYKSRRRMALQPFGSQNGQLLLIGVQSILRDPKERLRHPRLGAKAVWRFPSSETPGRRARSQVSNFYRLGRG